MNSKTGERGKEREGAKSPRRHLRPHLRNFRRCGCGCSRGEFTRGFRLPNFTADFADEIGICEIREICGGLVWMLKCEYRVWLRLQVLKISLRYSAKAARGPIRKIFVNDPR